MHLVYSSFNSLQTGKPIQRAHSTSPLPSRMVSIPFKRESLSKVVAPEEDYKMIVQKVSIPFKRESLSKDGGHYAEGDINIFDLVSIPFKRESLSKENLGVVCQTWTTRPFQFPSNGKAYPKWTVWGAWECGYSVSIPFKRESLSKVTTLTTRC